MKFLPSHLTFVLASLLWMEGVEAQDTVLPMTIEDKKDHFIYRQIQSSCLIDNIEVDIGMDHTHAGDIIVKLAHPDGTEVSLMSGQGGGADYDKDNIVFYRKHAGDSALDTQNGSVSSQTIKVPELDFFEGKSSEGRWKVTIRDRYGGDVGVIDHVELKVCVEGSISSPANDNSPSTGTGSLPSLFDSPGSDVILGADNTGFDDIFSSSIDTPVDPIPSDTLFDPIPDLSGAGDFGADPDDGFSSGETGLNALPPGALDDIDAALAPVADDTSSGGGSGASLLPPGAQADDDSTATDGDSRNGSRGGGGGDPHFKTWSGIKYDYHGECDLVLVDNPSFADGKGLRLHIRTVRKGYFSYIERAALQIGSDSLEFINRNEWTVNGVKPDNGQKVHVGGFRLFRFPGALSVRLDEREKVKIDFLDRKNGMPYIVVDGQSSTLFEGSLGMIGDWSTGTMLGRDGNSLIEDPETFALEWQVRDTEPMLFSSVRAPQFPAKCVPPGKMMGNRLGSSAMRKKAEKACAAWKEDKEDCIFDVMATRSIEAAETPVSVIG